MVTKLFNGNRLAIGLILSVVIGLLAALPVMKGVSQGHDSLFHLYRVVQLDELIQQGILFSRWAPDLVYGFGYPLFNYYAPLAYYLAETLHLLGLSLIGAFLGAFVLASVGASVFTYIWVRDLFGDVSALVAAAMYAFAPYMMITSIHRGALAEQLALSLLPIILWAFRRLILEGRWLYVAIGIVAYSALILTHNLTAFIFTPIVFTYALMVAFTGFKRSDGTLIQLTGKVAALFGVLLLALGLSAFYWLPALLERELVQLSQAYGPQVFNYEANFLSVRELFSLPFTVNPNQVNREIPISLGLIAVLSATFGVMGIWHFRGQRDQVAHIWFAALATLGSIFMTLAISNQIWEWFPMLFILQFPWRYVGLGSLFVAFLAGVGIDTVLEMVSNSRLNFRPVTFLIPALLVSATVLYVIPWQMIDYYQLDSPVDISDSLNYERDTGMIGTTTTGEYLPIHVQHLPDPEQLTFDSQNNRLDPSSLPESARISSFDYSPLNYSLEVDSPDPFTAVFNTLFFEGWQAKIDGQKTEIFPSQSYGLISVNVPSGQHNLEIYFGQTSLRRQATLLSLISIPILFLTIAVVFRRKSGQAPQRLVEAKRPVFRYFFFIVAFLLIAAFLKITYLDDHESIFRRTRFDGQVVANVEKDLRANFGDQLFLLGLDGPEQVATNESIDIILYWRLLREANKDYSVSTVVLDQNGDIVGQRDNQNIGDVPTTNWRMSQFAQDKHNIELLPGTPPGVYQLQIIVYESGHPDARLDILGVNGAPVGQVLTVKEITVIPAGETGNLSAIENLTLSDISIGDGINLAGYDLPDRTLTPGDKFYLALYWQATNDLDIGKTAHLSLVDENGEIVPLWESELVSGYSTSLWQKGDIWRGSYPLILPANLTTGIYTVSLSVDQYPAAELGSLVVEAPEHLIEKPLSAFATEVTFGDMAELIGYDVLDQVKPGEMLPVTLVWRSLSETNTGYKSFVQLLDDNGRLVVGSDKIPGDWQRPTTGWIGDEYIVDSHILFLEPDLAPGRYRLLVGLYDEDTNQRLPTDSGEDAWLLEVPVLVEDG